MIAEATHPIAERAPARPRGVVPVARRSLDVVLALVLCLISVPVFAVVAALIRLDSRGPVFFRQRRLGRDMRAFTCLKFRTMTADCDATPHHDYVRSLIRGDDAEPAVGGLYKLGVDQRVTRIGRVLRRWSLDELPQLLNVLRGEMALVGPRPVVPYEAEVYPDDYRQRFDVKPGLTGLWQVSGRNETTYHKMVELDLRYAERNSLLGDVGILFKTVWVVLTRRGVA